MKTKIIVSAFLINLFLTSLYAQDSLSTLPKDWKLNENSTDYIFGIENDKETNKDVTFLKSKTEIKKVSQFGVLSQVITANRYLGKRIKYSAFVKTSELEKWAGLWIRVDGDEYRPISFDNMADRPIKGTTNWTEYNAVIDIPINSDKIYFGFLISGNGKIYLDNPKFEIVDTNVHCTGKFLKQPLFSPQNLSFEIPAKNEINRPENWDFYQFNKANNYKISIVNDPIKNGNVLLIDLNNEIGKADLSVTQTIKSKNYLNTTIKISVYIKSENIENEVRLWLFGRKSNGKNMVNKNIWSNKIKGTTDWTKYELVSDIKNDPKTLMFGILFNGKGKIWVDDFTFEIIPDVEKGKLSSEISIEKLGNPPGTEQIAENVYLDKENISNLSYREFLFWMNKKYGASSQEYNSIVPDTILFKKPNNNNSILGDYYFRNPKFQEMPVIGVSINQAKQYSKWRSDRVMEWTLIKYGIIKLNQNAPKDSVLTIEKYFAGQFYNIKPSPYLLYYPEYQLLDSTVNTVAGFRNICTYKKWK